MRTIIAFFRNIALGDVNWACVRLFLVIAFVGGASTALVPITTDLKWWNIWHEILFPLALFTIITIFGMLVAQDILENSKKESRKIFYILVLIMLLINLIYLEIKYVVPGVETMGIFRYLVFPLGAMITAFLAGASYVQNIYNVESHAAATLYLVASFFGIGYPSLKVADGQKKIALGKVNRLEIIGGPGYIKILPGNVILTERLHNPAGVYSATNIFASRFESIVTTMNLDDQHGDITEVKAVTKDGIAVVVKDINFRYRVWSGHQVPSTVGGRNSINPYPFTVQAVRSLAYNRVVTKDGLISWHDTVTGAIKGAIADYIAKHQLDQITAPRYIEADPRKEISEQLKTPAIRDKLKDVGAQLLWCDIGHFGAESNRISEQRIDTWKAGWVGNAAVTRAYGEAQRIAYQDIGRAEAQAEVLMSIIHALDDIDLAAEDKNRNIRKIILLRTAQVLEAMTSASDEESKKNSTRKQG